MLLSAVSVLVVVQSSWEIPEGLMNNPVLSISTSYSLCYVTKHRQKQAGLSGHIILSFYLTIHTTLLSISL